jgi:hypothetical protein
MTDQSLPYSAARAEDKFYEMKRKGKLQGWWARILGRQNDLLPFYEVQKLVRGNRLQNKGLQDVPIDKIVGSEGRYQDFTRAFFPKDTVDKERWKRLDRALNRMENIPPVELYKIGDVYFVRDGHHRVSVARANGLKEIAAYVYEIDSDIDIQADSDLGKIALAVGKKRFLEKTNIDKLIPNANIELSEPDLYHRLLEHIDVHRYYMGIEQDIEIPYEEAVKSWYYNVYLPFVEAVRKSGILKHFPGRTETDLYVWVIENRDKLQRAKGKTLSPEETVEAFAEEVEPPLLQQVMNTLSSMIGIEKKRAVPKVP